MAPFSGRVVLLNTLSTCGDPSTDKLPQTGGESGSYLGNTFSPYGRIPSVCSLLCGWRAVDGEADEQG